MQDQPNVPYGYCWCGCGEKTRLASLTDRSKGYVRGEPLRYIHGHNGRKPDDDGPPVYCACGCGQKTGIPKVTDRSQGRVKGVPSRYLPGHAGAKKPVSAQPYIVDPATGCWLWQRAMSGDGYGQVRVKRRLLRAHRMMYERLVGPIPDGFDLDHLCRTPSCVNPDHLEPVTRTINVRRGVGPKLSVEAAQEIREAFAQGETRAALARKYQVGWWCINKVVTGVTWKP